jgi:hypothetical protein
MGNVARDFQEIVAAAGNLQDGHGIVASITTSPLTFSLGENVRASMSCLI